MNVPLGRAAQNLIPWCLLNKVEFTNSSYYITFFSTVTIRKFIYPRQQPKVKHNLFKR